MLHQNIIKLECELAADVEPAHDSIDSNTFEMKPTIWSMIFGLNNLLTIAFFQFKNKTQLVAFLSLFKLIYVQSI